MLLAEIADAWRDVGATRSRTAKIARLADVLTRLPPDELAAGAAFLSGAPRQGRVGVGWRTLADIDVPAADHPSLTIGAVDEAIGSLTTIAGSGSQGRRTALLHDLLARATAEEQQLLRGLLLHELRQGALEGIVTEAVARAFGAAPEAVRRAAMLAGDLTSVAVAVATSGPDVLATFRLELLRPLSPMLAQTAEDPAAALERTGPASVDAKLDGMRIQAHREGQQVRVFSRSLRDVTAELPGVVEAVAGLPVGRAVLDGEALSVGPDGRPRSFQESMSATGAGVARPYWFDILHLDGEDLLDQPLAQRLDALDRVVPADQRVARIRTDDAGAASAHLEAVLAEGQEGVVIKALDSPYEAGRRGAAWVKVKPVHTLDLVVLAAEWGSGRRRGWLSNLHLGARDPDGGFVMLGKTFKGLTDALLAWQTEALLAREVARDGHVVEVEPDLVVEIAFDGVQTSTRYPGGVTLRFARVVRYRDDKTAADADTIDTVRALRRG